MALDQPATTVESAAAGTGGPITGSTTLSGHRGLLTVLVVLAFVMNALARGVGETFAVFLLPVEAALGLTRDRISLAYSVYMIAFGVAAPFAGQMIDRLGARITYTAGLAALGLGYVMASQATALPVYIIGVGLLGGLGSAALGMVVASSLLSRWFTERIASIVSLPYAASGVGMLLLPLAAQLILERHDWRTAQLWIGLGVLALIPVLVVLPLRRIGAGSPAWQAMRQGARLTGPVVWPLRSAARTAAFWSIGAVYFTTSVAAYAVLPHSVAHLVEQGFSPIFAASVFGLTGLLSAAGIVAIAWMSDRWGRRPAVTLSYVMSMLGIAALLLVVVWPSPMLVYAFVLLFGSMQGARGPVLVALIAKIFHGGSVGSIFGTLTLAMGSGAALGSWVSGLLHEWSGNYNASLVFAFAASGLGLALFWLAPSLVNETADGRRNLAPSQPGA